MPIDIGWTPEDLIRRDKAPEDMTAREIRQYIKHLASTGQPTAAYETQMHGKFALPIAATIFALVGIPLGVRRDRSRSAAMGFGISILIIFAYWTTWYCCSIAGEGGTIPPIVGAWLPNVIFGGMGVALLVRGAR